MMLSSTTNTASLRDKADVYSLKMHVHLWNRLIKEQNVFVWQNKSCEYLQNGAWPSQLLINSSISFSTDVIDTGEVAFFACPKLITKKTTSMLKTLAFSSVKIETIKHLCSQHNIKKELKIVTKYLMNFKWSYLYGLFRLLLLLFSAKTFKIVD